MKPKTLLMFVVAGACGLLALLGFQSMQGSQTAPKIETAKVLVVTAEIGAGQALTADNVKFKQLPVSNLPADPVLTEEQYAERSALIPMMPGDTVSMSKLTEKGVSGSSASIPKGWRVYTIAANDSITNSGMLHAGDRVDVLITYKARAAKGNGTIEKTKTLLEYVEVFATDDRTASRADGEAARTKNVSLLLTPEQVNFVILAMSKGKLDLAWRHRMDDELVQVDEVDGALLDELSGTVGMYEDRPLYEMAAKEELPAYEARRPVDPNAPEEPAGAAEFLDSASSQAVAAPAPVAPSGPTWKVQVFNGNSPQVQQFALTEEKEVKETASANWVSSGLKTLFGAPASSAPTTVQ